MTLIMTFWYYVQQYGSQSKISLFQWNDEIDKIDKIE